MRKVESVKNKLLTGAFAAMAALGVILSLDVPAFAATLDEPVTIQFAPYNPYIYKNSAVKNGTIYLGWTDDNDTLWHGGTGGTDKRALSQMSMIFQEYSDDTFTTPVGDPTSTHIGYGRRNITTGQPDSNSAKSGNYFAPLSFTATGYHYVLAKPAYSGSEPITPANLANATVDTMPSFYDDPYKYEGQNFDNGVKLRIYIPENDDEKVSSSEVAEYWLMAYSNKEYGDAANTLESPTWYPENWHWLVYSSDTTINISSAFVREAVPNNGYEQKLGTLVDFFIPKTLYEQDKSTGFTWDELSSTPWPDTFDTDTIKYFNDRFDVELQEYSDDTFTVKVGDPVIGDDILTDDAYIRPVSVKYGSGDVGTHYYRLRLVSKADGYKMIDMTTIPDRTYGDGKTSVPIDNYSGAKYKVTVAEDEGEICAANQYWRFSGMQPEARGTWGWSSRIWDTSSYYKFLVVLDPQPAKLAFIGAKSFVYKDSGKKAPLSAGDFSFVLTDTKSSSEIQTVSNDADGKITFDPLSIASTGDYSYSIAEKDTGKDKVTYDTTVKNYNVTATSDWHANIQLAVIKDE